MRATRVKEGLHISLRELQRQAQARVDAGGFVAGLRCVLCHSPHQVITYLNLADVYHRATGDCDPTNVCRHCRLYRRDDVITFLSRTNRCTALMRIN